MQKPNIISLISTFIAIISIASCSVKEQTAADEMCGSVEVIDIQINTDIQSLIPTKVTLPTVTAPEDYEFTYTIRNKKTSEVRFTKTGLITEPVILPAGEYTLEATKGVNGFGEVYFIGTNDFTVVSGERTTVSVNVKIGNSAVYIQLGSDVNTHLNVTGISLTDGTDEITGVKLAQWYYVPSGRNVSVHLEGTNSVGVTRDDFDVALGSLNPSYAYTVTCNLTLPTLVMPDQSQGAWGGCLFVTPAQLRYDDGTSNTAANDYTKYFISADGGSTWTEGTRCSGFTVFSGLTNGKKYKVKADFSDGKFTSEPIDFTPVACDVSVELNLSKSATGVLTGTNATATITENTYVSSLMKSLGGNYGMLLNNGSSDVRSVSLQLNNSDKGKITAAMSNVNNWPYLPAQGKEYTVKPYCVINGSKIYLNTSECTNNLIPEFSVEASAYTSYDCYKGFNGRTGSLTDANNCDGSTLYNAGASWTISEEIMRNDKYEKTLNIYIDGSKSRNYPVTNSFYEDISSLSWTAHTHKAEIVFDGKSVSSAETTHQVTGIPHHASFYETTTQPDNWIIGGTYSWEGYGWNVADKDYLRLRGNGTASNRGYALSPIFYIPDSSLNVKTILDCFYYHSTTGKTATIYVNVDTGNNNFKDNGTTIKTNANFDNFGSVADVVSSLTLSSDKRISITTSMESKDRLSTWFMGIKSMSIYYR